MTDLNCAAGECQCGLKELPERLRESLESNSLAAMRADIEFLLGRLKCRYAGQSSGGLDDDITPCEEPEKCNGLPPCAGWKRRPITSKKYQHGAGGPEAAGVEHLKEPSSSPTENGQQRDSQPAPAQSGEPPPVCTVPDGMSFDKCHAYEHGKCYNAFQCEVVDGKRRFIRPAPQQPRGAPCSECGSVWPSPHQRTCSQHPAPQQPRKPLPTATSEGYVWSEDAHRYVRRGV